MDCSPAVVEVVAGSSRFAPHFHLPLQHASDDILVSMCRPYSLDAYRRLVDGILHRLPHASIGSDMIAGFPGESDRHFAANAAFLPYSDFHTFMYFPTRTGRERRLPECPARSPAAPSRTRVGAPRQWRRSLAPFREAQTTRSVPLSRWRMEHCRDG